MKKKLFVILGNQLFHPKELKKLGCEEVFMAEDYGLCTYEKHHKLKLYLYLTSMREYKDELESASIKVNYFKLEERKKEEEYSSFLIKFLKKQKTSSINIFEIEDKPFEESLLRALDDSKILINTHESPMFLLSKNEFKSLAKGSKKYRMASFYKKMRNVALFAFSTSSSAATIPVTLKTVTDDLGVKKDVSSFVVPVGATINMDGTAIMQGLATMFIASTVGVDLTLIQYGQIVLLAIVTSIGTAAVPSAGTVTLALILGSIGLPLDAIGLILAVDRILDMIRTSVNVCGDAAVSCIVAKSEGEFDQEVFDSRI